MLIPVLSAVGVGLVLTLSPSVAHTQTRPTGMVGLALGLSHPPAAMQDMCVGPSALGTLEVRSGIRRGAVSLEARGSAQESLASVECVLDPISYPDGVHTELLYPFRRGGLLTTDLRTHVSVPGVQLLGVGAGAGWVWSHDLPYVLVAAGLRSSGRTRLVADVERTWFRVPFETLTREWKDHVPVQEISRERRQDWQSGWNLRVGVDLGLW